MDPPSNTSSPTLTMKKKMSPILKHSGSDRNGTVLSREASFGLMGSPEHVKSTSPKQNSASFTGIVTSKRLAKRLTNRMINGRTRSVLSSRMSATTKEPTYRMEPKYKFSPTKVCEVTEAILEDKLQEVEYNPQTCASLTRVLSEEIKAKVKALKFERYKIVVIVHIGDKKSQGVRMCSRCAWDAKLDNYANCSYQSTTLYCNVTVYGLYNE